MIIIKEAYQTVNNEKFKSTHEKCKSSEEELEDQCQLQTAETIKLYLQEIKANDKGPLDEKIKNFSHGDLNILENSVLKSKKQFDQVVFQCIEQVQNFLNSICKKPEVGRQEVVLEASRQAPSLKLQELKEALPSVMVGESQPVKDPEPVVNKSMYSNTVKDRIDLKRQDATELKQSLQALSKIVSFDITSINNTILSARDQIEEPNPNPNPLDTDKDNVRKREEDENPSQENSTGPFDEPSLRPERPLGPAYGGAARPKGNNKDQEKGGGLLSSLGGLGKIIPPGVITKFFGKRTGNHYGWGNHRRPANPLYKGKRPSTHYTRPQSPLNGGMSNEDGGADLFSNTEPRKPTDLPNNGKSRPSQSRPGGGSPSSAMMGTSGPSSSGRSKVRSQNRQRRSSGNKVLFGKHLSSQEDSPGVSYHKTSYSKKDRYSRFFGSKKPSKKGHLQNFDPNKYIPSQQLQRRAYERMTGRKVAALSPNKTKSFHWPCYIIKEGDSKIPLSIFRVQRIRIQDIISNQNKEKSCTQN